MFVFVCVCVFLRHYCIFTEVRMISPVQVYVTIRIRDSALLVRGLIHCVTGSVSCLSREFGGSTEATAANSATTLNPNISLSILTSPLPTSAFRLVPTSADLTWRCSLVMASFINTRINSLRLVVYVTISIRDIECHGGPCLHLDCVAQGLLTSC